MWFSFGGGKHSHPKEGRRRHPKRGERVEVRAKKSHPKGCRVLFPLVWDFCFFFFFFFSLSLQCALSWVVVRSPYFTNSLSFLSEKIDSTTFCHFFLLRFLLFLHFRRNLPNCKCQNRRTALPQDRQTQWQELEVDLIPFHDHCDCVTFWKKGRRLARITTTRSRSLTRRSTCWTGLEMFSILSSGVTGEATVVLRGAELTKVEGFDQTFERIRPEEPSQGIHGHDGSAEPKEGEGCGWKGGEEGGGGLSNAVADWDVVVKTLKTDHKCNWMTRSRLLC